MGVDCVQLKNGDVVKISAISVTNECYVVPVNEEFNEERNKFLDSVVLHCRKGVANENRDFIILLRNRAISMKSLKFRFS